MMLFASLIFSACVQTKSLRELNSHAVTLHRQGHYSKAARTAKKALKHGEKRFGTNHPDIALFMNNLAGIYYSQGKYDKAESHYKKALTLITKVLGKNHPDVAAIAENMAEFYRKIGKDIEASELEGYVREIRTRSNR